MSSQLRQYLFQDSLQEPPPSPLATRAAEAMRLGDFKQAIDLFKRLVKQDGRPEWKDALADAYAGRARILAAKGMFEEAEIALGKTAAPDGTVRDPLLFVKCLVKCGRTQKASEFAMRYAEDGKVPAADALQLAELAAALWLTAPVPLVVPAYGQFRQGKQPELNWVEHASAAQQSLAAWIEGKPPQEIDQLLSRIPLRSPFRALRLILKSLITAPDDPARARRLLDGIPSDSPFASFRLAVEDALPQAQAEPIAEFGPSSKAQLVFAAEVKNVSNAMSQTLAQLTKAERNGPAALLSFLISRARTFAAAEVKSACLNLLPHAVERLHQFEAAFGPLSEFEKNRVLALAAEAANRWRKAEQYWCIAARSVERAADTEARLAAGVIYRHLARLTKGHPEIEGEGDSGLSDIEYLERSVEADPGYLPAVLDLIKLYRTHERDKDWHRLVAEAMERFPEECSVLQQAVDSAIARKAYKMGAGFARRLLALDPINQAARQQMIELNISHARKQSRAKRFDLASKELARAAEWEKPGAPSFLLRINQGLVGRELGQEAAESIMRQGVELAGGGVAGWFHASLEHALMNGGAANATRLRQELFRVAQAAAPTKEEVLSVAAAVNGTPAHETKKAVAGLVFRIRGWLSKASSLGWSPAEFHLIADMFGRADAYDLLGDYAKLADRREPRDATWSYYRLVARVKGDSRRLSFAETQKLMDISDDASRRRDFPMANRIQRFMDGPDARSRQRSRRISGADPSEDEAAELLTAFLNMSLGDTPPALVEQMIADLGPRGAVKALVDRLRASPLGGMPQTMLRGIAQSLVDSVTMGRGGSQP